MENKISVVIPTYNREKLVVRSVKSVLKQTYKNIEVIVVDDCSTDNTEAKIKKINDKRLKYIRLDKNSGACVARNTGIDNATGKYVAFQDSDDVFDKDKLEKQLDNLLKNDSDMDFCKLHVYVEDNVYVFPGDVEDENIDKNGLLNQLCNGNLISTQTILIKRSVLDEIRFDPRLPRFQDYDFVLRVAGKYKISYLKKVLVDVYRQDDSISSSYEKLKKACFVMLKKNYLLDEKQKDVLMNTLLYWYSKEELDNYSDILEKYNSLKEQFDNISNKYDRLVDNNQLISNDHKKLINDYYQLDEKYKSIIESKRWKLLSKIMKIFGK